MSSGAIARAGWPVTGNVPPGKPGQPADVPSALYNGMVSPWNDFAIRAAMWYQGEANADQKVSVQTRGVG